MFYNYRTNILGFIFNSYTVKKLYISLDEYKKAPQNLIEYKDGQSPMKIIFSDRRGRWGLKENERA